MWVAAVSSNLKAERIQDITVRNCSNESRSPSSDAAPCAIVRPLKVYRPRESGHDRKQSYLRARECVADEAGCGDRQRRGRFPFPLALIKTGEGRYIEVSDELQRYPPL